MFSERIVKLSTKEELTRAIEDYYRIRELKQPDTWQALGWAATEIGEAYEILLAKDKGWVRNNPDGKPGWDAEKFGEELGDVVMMLIVAGLREGVDVIKLLGLKMNRKLLSHFEQEKEKIRREEGL